MLFDDLHRRFGNHVARRVWQELTIAELRETAIADLAALLDQRVRRAELAYRRQNDKPTLTGKAQLFRRNS